MPWTLTVLRSTSAAIFSAGMKFPPPPPRSRPPEASRSAWSASSTSWLNKIHVMGSASTMISASPRICTTVTTIVKDGMPAISWAATHSIARS